MTLILYVFAFVFFVLATFGIGGPRCNLIAAGLACLTASLLFK